MGDHAFAVIEGLLVLSFFFIQLVVEVELVDQGFGGACVEHIHNAGFNHFVESDGVVPAVVEYFHDLGIDHHISQYFPSQPKGLEVCLLVHVPNVYQEGVSAIIELDHLYEPSLSEVPLQVNSQHFARQNVRGTDHQRLKRINVVRLSFFQLLSIVKVQEQFFFLVRLLEGALAGLEFEVFEEMAIEGGVVDELSEGEEEKVIMFQNKVGLHLVQYSGVVGLQSFAQMTINIVPADDTVGKLFF